MLAKQIRFLRQSMQLNQVELGKRLGVAKQSISNWEKDNIMPSVEMLVKIADFFHVSTDYLLGRDYQESDSIKILDIIGLTPEQIKHIQYIVDDLRGGEE